MGEVTLDLASVVGKVMQRGDLPDFVQFCAASVDLARGLDESTSIDESIPVETGDEKFLVETVDRGSPS